MAEYVCSIFWTGSTQSVSSRLPPTVAGPIQLDELTAERFGTSEAHTDPLIAAASGGHRHLQVVVGHHDRATLERQSRPHGAHVGLAESPGQLGADVAERPRPVAYEWARHPVGQGGGLGPVRGE